MEIVKKRQFSDIALGFFLLSHPMSILLHILGVAAFTLLAAWTHPAWGRVVLVIAAYTAMQVSIAMLSDYCDRGLDAASKPDKPIPRELVSPREALIGGLVMIGVMLLLLLPLSPLALLISLCCLALGQAYNLGLKSTPWSRVVLALALPLIPLYAFVGVGRPLPLLFGLVPVGFMLGVALILAHSLIGLEDDHANGAKTLAIVLGVKHSFLACQLLIVLAATLIGLLTVIRAVPVQPWIVVLTLILTCLTIEAMILFFGPDKPVGLRKLYFYLVAFTCILLAGGWLVGVLA